MELVCNNIQYVYKSKMILNNVSFKIDSSCIVGVIGQFKTLLLEIIDLQKKYSGEIIVDGVRVDSSNLNNYRRKISLISQNNFFYTSSVFEEMKFIMEYYNYHPKDLKKRMLDSLKMVGLSPNYLNRKFRTLSNSEKILVNIACSFITNPDIILFDDVFVGLDYCNKMKILNICKKLQREKNRVIVFASNDVDFLYECTEKVLVLEKGSILTYGYTEQIFSDIDFLEIHNLDVPNLVKFTKLARGKNVKLSFHRDILDLIKDVYKHV